MIKNVYLHIGMHKTGTSSIQQFLIQNKSPLLKKGYFFPGYKVHHSLASEIREVKKKITLEYPKWKDTLFEAEQTRAHSVILSAESFSTLKKKVQLNALSTLLSHYRCKVIIYLRQPHEKIESEYTQLLKSGQFTGNISDYVEKRRNGDIIKYLNLWSNEFGTESIVLRSHGSFINLSHDFLNAIGINDMSDFEDISPQNTKPSLSALRILGYFNGRLATELGHVPPGYFHLQDEFKELKKYILASPINQDGAHQYKLLPYDLAMKIWESYRTTHEKISSLFNDDKILALNNTFLPYEHIDIELTDLELAYIEDLKKDEKAVQILTKIFPKLT